MPVPARVLAIDPGKRSGWCYLRPVGAAAPTLRGKVPAAARWLANVGSCDVWSQDPLRVVQVFGPVADVIVIEDPGAGGSGRFMTMVLSLGAAIGVWRWAWRVHGADPGKVPGKELDVPAVSWRSGLLGGTARARETDEWKRASVEHARLVEDAGAVLFAPDQCVPGGIVSVEWNAESADAFGAAWWAVHSPRLVDELGSKWCKAAGWDDRAACLAAQQAPPPPDAF